MTFFKRTTEGQFAKKHKPLSKRGKRFLLGFIALCLVTNASHATFQAVKPTTLFYKATGYAEAAEMPAVPREMDVMLAKIAKCESGSKQFYDDGRVVLNVNKDGSADVGMYQVNLRDHGAQIARMKLDVINSEEDNRAFAEYLLTSMAPQIGMRAATAGASSMQKSYRKRAPRCPQCIHGVCRACNQCHNINDHYQFVGPTMLCWTC